MKNIEQCLEKLRLALHPDKCKIIPLSSGTCFLGFKVFYYHKIVRKKNLRKIRTKLRELISKYNKKRIDAETAFKVMTGWNGYALQGDTYHLRQELEQTLKKQLKYLETPYCPIISEASL